MALLRRLVRADHPAIPFTLDGEPCEGRAGDTVLTAILTQAERLRLSEFSASPHAGFCWIVLESGERLRACSTALSPGMRILTRRARAA